MPTKRERIGQVVAFAALVAALVGALGPAERVRTTYSWPPADTQSGAPNRVWYTPLLLVRHRPEGIKARIPCSPAPPLRGASSPVKVLATARHPERTGGLAVIQEPGTLVVQVGTRRLVAAPLPADSGGPDCAYALRLGGGGWSLEGGAGELNHAGTLERDPVVSGLFSELDLAAAGAPSIAVTTQPHSTRAAVHQKVAWLVATLAIAAAIGLVAIRRTPAPPWTVAWRLVRAGAARAGLVDAFVGVSLLAWLVIAPAVFDDGWLFLMQRTYEWTGGFSLYYNTFATNLPLGFWLEWSQHWLAEVTSALVFLRLPALACLAAAWLLCRWTYGRIRPVSAERSSLGVWALGCAFVLGAMAWGMTLRQEPATGLLVVAVMACMVRFRERRSTGSVAAAAALVPFALTAHPAGIVSLAPVLVEAGALLRWVRSRPAAATALFAAACALLTLLLFVGSDVDQRIYEIQAAAPYSAISAEWQDETARYALLSHEPYATPVRRAAVVLVLLAAASFILRRRRESNGAADAAGAALVLGVLLLVATPSKWPWHFGTLVGIGAVAVAIETDRLRAAIRERRWSVWPFAVVGAAAVAGSWPWARRTSWNPADLRTLDWTPELGGGVTMARVAFLLPLALLAGATLLALVRQRREELLAVPWLVACWTALVVALPPIAFTAGVLVADSTKTSGWTLARQNLGAIAGDQGCGLADDLSVPVRASMRPLAPLGGAQGAALPRWLPPAPVAGLSRFVLSPASGGSAQSQWFRLPAGGRFGLFVAGAPAARDSVWLEWGRPASGRIVPVATEELDRRFDGYSGTAPWRFLAAGELPRHDEKAKAVRLSARAVVAPGSAIAVTEPVTYTNEPLTPALRRDGSLSLVYGNLLAYFPCARLPKLGGGVVEVPDRVVSTDRFSLFSGDEASSFHGLLDLHELERTSVADSENWPEDVHLFEVDRDIPGARLLAPDSVTFTS
jgi:hypothetical protein